jgi:hypothetical protein
MQNRRVIMLDRRELLERFAGACGVPVHIDLLEVTKPLLIVVKIDKDTTLTEKHVTEALKFTTELSKMTKINCVLVPPHLSIEVKEDPRK